MVTPEAFRLIALSFKNAKELPHFEKSSFRIKKKIFATLTFEENRACVKLSQNDQLSFCAFDSEIVFPVNNKWGLQGWTLINLKKINKTMLKQILSASYKMVHG